MNMYTFFSTFNLSTASLFRVFPVMNIITNTTLYTIFTSYYRMGLDQLKLSSYKFKLFRYFVINVVVSLKIPSGNPV